MARFDKALANKVVQWGKDNIPNDILSKHGREEDVHVTIKYGLHTENFDLIKTIFKDEKPIKLELGKIGYFRGDDNDVVLIKVNSDDLVKLNEKICNELQYTDTFSEYKPHCTIAYVKKGEAHKYAGDSFFKGQKITVNKIIFTDKIDNEYKINLK